jgi:uncharacterized protein YdhG (YjbR/CyaY superfamily)
MNKSKAVDKYIAEAPSGAQRVLVELRALIREVIPEAEEGLWYSIPYYKYYGEFVGFGAFTKHISFGYGKDVISESDKTKLESQGYKVGKGTLQIKFDQKLPHAAIKKILKTKAKQNEKSPGMNINLK